MVDLGDISLSVSRDRDARRAGVFVAGPTAVVLVFSLVLVGLTDLDAFKVVAAIAVGGMLVGLALIREGKAVALLLLGAIAVLLMIRLLS